jgi:hypothetical protein
MGDEFSGIDWDTPTLLDRVRADRKLQLAARASGASAYRGAPCAYFGHTVRDTRTGGCLCVEAREGLRATVGDYSHKEFRVEVRHLERLAAEAAPSWGSGEYAPLT